jgi:hypothetical protein
VGTGDNKTGTGKYSLLIVVKGRHRYLMKYDAARKGELFDLLVSYAMSGDYNLTAFDAFALIEKLKQHNGSASMISLSEDKPAVERDLSFESPEPGTGELDAGLNF